jgi:hypothetical protein
MMALVSPLALAILGAVALALIYRREAGPGDRAGPARAGQAIVSDDGGTVHVTLGVADADILTKLVVHGPDGEGLVRFLMYQNGAFTIEPTGSDSAPFIVHRDSARSVQMGMSKSRANFALLARTDGSVDMRVTNPVGEQVYGVRVTAEGNVLPHEDLPAP